MDKKPAIKKHWKNNNRTKKKENLKTKKENCVYNDTLLCVNGFLFCVPRVVGFIGILHNEVCIQWTLI